MYITNAMIAVMMMIPAMLFAVPFSPALPLCSFASEEGSVWEIPSTPGRNIAMDARSLDGSSLMESQAFGGLTAERVELLISQDGRTDQQMEKGELIDQKNILLRELRRSETARDRQLGDIRRPLGDD